MNAPSPIAPLPSPIRALVIAREPGVREAVRVAIALAGHRVHAVAEVEEARLALAGEIFDAIVVDGAQLRADGLALLDEEVPSIALVRDDLTDGARLVGEGAHGAVGWPIDAHALRLSVERAARASRMARELSALRTLLGGRADSVLIGRSPAMQRLRELVQRAAASRATVVVSGEAGVGKELVARTIHALSPESHGSCTLIECAGREVDALEQELFGGPSDAGRVPGGALAREGVGTLIVDDATALPALLQTRLLRALQARAVGGRSARRLVITVREHRAPEAGAPAPRYDLLGRAGVLAIAIPPLRDRRSDIPLLTAQVRARFARETGCEPPPIAAEVVNAMLGHDWPGNVRQLEQYVARLLLLPPGVRAPIDAPSLAPADGSSVTSLASLVAAARAGRWSIEQLEREYIQCVLAEEGGHQSRAAELLGIDRRTLYRKLKQYRAADVARRRGSGTVHGSERSA